MNEYKQQHIEKRNAVIDCLSQAEQFFSAYGYEAKAKVAAAQKNNVENGEFCISVVGEFSAGKSTFLNALMGKRILPSFTKETTATINFLRHKDKSESGEAGKVYYKDEHNEVIQSADKDVIEKFVSTESNIEVVEKISHLDLYLDSPFLSDNVTLVDTPGLNGIAEEHREITEEQIEKSSAGIFLFDANQPGKLTDFEFILALRKRLRNLIFVLNKIDVIHSEEGESVESVVKKLKSNYKLVCGEGASIPEIWPISAYNALCARDPENTGTKKENDKLVKLEESSRMKAFEDRLWRFLANEEKTRAMLVTPIEMLEDLLKEVKDSLNAEKNALSGAVDSSEIEEQMLNIENSITELEAQKKANTVGIKEELRRCEKEFSDAVKSGAEQCKALFERKIDNFTDLDDIAPEKIVRGIKTEMEKIIGTAYEDYCNDVRGIQFKYAVEITEKLNEDLDSELNVQIDNKLELPEISVGLERMEKEELALKSKIEELRREAEEGELAFSKALENQAKIERLENELIAKKEKREYYEQSSLTFTPDARVHTMPKKRRREGFHPFKPYEYVQESVIDDSDRKEYLANRQVILDKHEKEIFELEKKLQSMPADNIKAAETIAKQKNRRLAEIQEELRRMQEKNNAEIKRKNAIQFKRQKNSLNEYIDRVTADYIKESRKDFRDKRDKQIGLILEIIENSIRDKLERKKQELELLRKKQNQAVEEKNLRLTEIDTQFSILNKLMGKALDTESMIKSDEVDVIREDKI